MSVNPERRCDDPLRQEVDWRGYVVRAGRHFRCMGDNPDPKEHREHVEPWLSALFQAEHLNVLVGSGLTTAIACAANVPAVDMNVAQFGCSQSDAVALAAQKNAKSVGREKPNIEDQLRTVIELIGGLRILASNSVGDSGNDDIRQAAADLLQQWKPALDNALSVFLKKVLATERGIGAALAGTSGQQQAVPVRRLLGGVPAPLRQSRRYPRTGAHLHH